MSSGAVSSTNSAAPQGRSQLLYWLNGLCNSDYPAIESLRDGAAYCTILEAAINRIAENSQAVKTKDAGSASQRAQRASSALSKLDWSATSHVCNDVDPTLDSIVVSASCRKNMAVLLEMTTHCIPPDHARSIDVERMARGRFQDHVQFLQWLYQFMARVLSVYSKASLREAMTAPSGVEGVKLNRTMRMRQQQTASTRSSSSTNIRDAKAVGASSHGLQRSSSANARQSTEGLYAHSDAVVMESDDAVNSTHQHWEKNSAPERTHAHSHRSLHQDDDASLLQAPSSSTGGGGAKPATATPASPAPVYWDRGAVTVPASEKPVLLDVRREVEQIEALVLYACDVYQGNLTRNALQEATAAAQPAPSELVRACLAQEPALTPPPAPTVSLSELGQLLDERDQMAQLYERVRLLVGQYERKYGSSPLMREIKSLLQPDSPVA